MEVKKKVEEQILHVISDIGHEGATIVEIEKHVPFERHTLSKYLSFMQGHGLVYHKKVGKAKLWHISDAPLKTILHSPDEHKTFTERILSNLINRMPLGLVVVDAQYKIQFCNDFITKRYGQVEDNCFYKVVLGRDNPLKIREVTDIMEHKAKSAEVFIKDLHNEEICIRASRVVNPNNTESFILLIEDVGSIERHMKKERKNGR